MYNSGNSCSWNVYQYISVQMQRLDLPYRPIRCGMLKRKRNVQGKDEGIPTPRDGADSAGREWCWWCYRRVAACKTKGMNEWLLLLHEIMGARTHTLVQPAISTK